ncbi:MAG TPA: glutathione S-transferase family protein [Alphaproteobacteria bacterium]
MTETILFGNPASTYVRTVRLALEEKGAKYRIEEIDLKDPAYAARHPFRRMPSFEHDGVRLFETQAICRYVDEAVAGPALQPGDALGRARMEQWVSAVCDYLYPTAIRGYVLHYVFARRDGREPDRAAIAQSLPTVKERLGIFDAALGKGTYLAGDKLSIADLFLAPIAFYVCRAMPEKDQMIAGRANLARWLAAMESRPSFAATMPPLAQAAE